MDNQRIRICDIAEELGVSTATVSHVIHGKTSKVSEETARRVMALLEERQYVPHMAGILLAQNSSRIIGVFVNDHEKYEGHTLDDFFIASSLNCLSTQIERSGQFMLVKKAKHAEEIIRFASMWNMDGVIIIGFCRQDYAYLRSHMRIPFVIYDGICDNPERMLNITIDNDDGGYQVGQYFRQSGHRRALCLADNDTGVDRQRMDGFLRGFAPGTAEQLLLPMHKEERWQFYRRNIDIFHRVTAVFAVSDYYAMDLLCFLHEAGLSVPEDISLAGFDDSPICQLSCPPLTSVRQDGDERAALALEKLRELQAGTATETTLTLPVSLVVRGSTRSISL